MFQFVIDNQVLHCLYLHLTQNNKKIIKKEACWATSNITTRRNQIQAVIKANIIPPLVHLLQHGEFDVKKKAALGISNATVEGSHDQISYLVSQGLRPLCDLLICPDPMIVMVCLEGLKNILKADIEMGTDSFEVNLYAQIVYECDGLDKIENNLTIHDNEICDKAVKLFEKYCRTTGVEEQKLMDLYCKDLENWEANYFAGGFNFE